MLVALIASGSHAEGFPMLGFLRSGHILHYWIHFTPDKMSANQSLPIGQAICWLSVGVIQYFWINCKERHHWGRRLSHQLDGYPNCAALPVQLEYEMIQAWLQGRTFGHSRFCISVRNPVPQVYPWSAQLIHQHPPWLYTPTCCLELSAFWWVYQLPRITFFEWLHFWSQSTSPFLPYRTTKCFYLHLHNVALMGIHPGEPKRTTFCARHFLWALVSSMHKSACRGAHEYLRVMGLERAESRRVPLSSGLCLES